MIENLPGGTDETRYGRVPLWLFETGVSLQAVGTYAWLHGKYGHFKQKIPSYATLARELGVSRSSVINHIKELASVGAVAVTNRVDESGHRTTNSYWIAFNAPLPVGGQNADQGAAGGGGQHSDQVDQGEPEKGGQHSDQGGQPADQGGQHADPGWSAGCAAEEDVLEEDDSKKTKTNNNPPALPGMPDPGPAAEEPKPEPGSDQDPEFVAWWQEYPTKVGKGAARRAWRAARKKTDFTTLMVGLRRYLAQDPRAAAGYVKHPSTWLNGECWADEPDTIPTPRPAAEPNVDVWHRARERWADQYPEEVHQ